MNLPVSRRLNFSDIPVIDMESLLDGDGSGSAIDALEKACTNVGFFYIRNHGIPANLINSLQQEAHSFFKLPMDTKNLIKINHQIRGYLPLYYRSYEGEERAGTSHQEGFWIGHEIRDNEHNLLDGPNQWPEEAKSLRPSMEAYFDAVSGLANHLLQGFAMALKLDPHTFTKLYKKPNSRLKLNHYPPQNDPVAENNIGVVPHTDSGGFTILWQDDHGGLEIQNKDGDWVGAPPIPDTFVVNIGNLMQIWSNGRFSSTPHRVINRGGNDRYSIPLFVNPDYDTMIEPLLGDNNNFEPMHYGDYQTKLWRRTFPIANV